MLKDLDELERTTEGGTECWVAHGDHFAWASQHVHPSFCGPLVPIDTLEPDELVGVTALVYGHQYLALSAVNCAIAADLQDLKQNVEQRYATVADLQHAELRRLTEKCRLGEA